MGEQEGAARLVRHHDLIAKALQILHIVVKVLHIALVRIGQQASGEPLASVVIQIDAIALLIEVVRQLLILDVALDAAVNDQDRIMAGRIAQRDIAQRYAIDAADLTRLGVLMPEPPQGLQLNLRQRGGRLQMIRIVHSLRATRQREEEEQ